MDYKRELLFTFKKINVNGLSFQEKNIIEEVKAWIKLNTKATCRLDDFGNLWIELKGKGKKELVYTTHLDVVAPIGTVCIDKKRKVLRIKETTGMILGADSRAGVSVILNVFKLIAKAKKSYKSLTILFTIVEESGFQGIRHADLTKLNAECIISADRPIRTWGRNRPNVINCHLAENEEIKVNKNLLKLWKSAKSVKRKIILHNANHRNAYTGGDASFIKDFDVFDFCVGTSHQHCAKEELSLKAFFASYKVMLAFSKQILK